MLKKNIKKMVDYLKISRSGYYLKKNAPYNINSNEIRIGFLVFEPETWDKLNSVYFALKNRSDVEVQLIVVPNFDVSFDVTTKYGDEFVFFKNVDNSAIKAYSEDEGWLNLKKFKFDYLFYQDPYNNHMPKELNSNSTVKYTKICYVPYGFSISNNFNQGNSNIDFFRNVSFSFCDVTEIKNILDRKFHKNVSCNIQHFFDYGYPSLADYAKISAKNRVTTIGWMPRWSYDPIIGGSHFLEYKDKFLDFITKNRNLHFVFRPHPMMFTNLINNNLISKKSADSFIARLKDLGVTYSKGKSLLDDIADIDLLITDFSSVIPAFFITGKPLIYCNSPIPFNDSFSQYMDSIYVANSWEEVSRLANDIKEGSDSLLTIRQERANFFKEKHLQSCEKIVNTLVDDFIKCRPR